MQQHFDETGMAPRIRPGHALVAGALLVGWSAERARATVVDSDPPEQSKAAPSVGSSAGERHVERRRHRLFRPRLAVGLVLGTLLFASTGFSAGPEGAGLRVDRRPAARQARIASKRAETTRLADLRHLQLAGIAGRRAGLPQREVLRIRRIISAATLPPVRPSERAVALDRYLQALGPQTILEGLDNARTRLELQVLNDSRLQIYPGGRNDISAHRIDVRVLALLEYLAQVHGEVTVSCLTSGHSYYVDGRPGVVSAHIFGRAVDIAAVAGVSILGHQEPGGITDQTVLEILALPESVLPRQVISLLTLGGPSFALADHANHIHVGY